MPRNARIVLPDVPHHVTQRGVRKMQTFFTDDDYRLYGKLLAIFSRRANVKVVAWCLMPNHVHLLLIPSDKDGLRATIAPLHRAYSYEINKQQGWTGHLWQSRFSSFPTDPHHTAAAARYIELNPVRANLADAPSHYPWSSAHAHVSGLPDGITDLEAAQLVTDDWKGLLASGLDERELQALRAHESNGFPLGSKQFIDSLEARFGHPLRPGKPGRPRL